MRITSAIRRESLPSVITPPAAATGFELSSESVRSLLIFLSVLLCLFLSFADFFAFAVALRWSCGAPYASSVAIFSIKAASLPASLWIFCLTDFGSVVLRLPTPDAVGPQLPGSCSTYWRTDDGPPLWTVFEQPPAEAGEPVVSAAKPPITPARTSCRMCLRVSIGTPPLEPFRRGGYPSRPDGGSQLRLGAERVLEGPRAGRCDRTRCSRHIFVRIRRRHVRGHEPRRGCDRLLVDRRPGRCGRIVARCSSLQRSARRRGAFRGIRAADAALDRLGRQRGGRLLRIQQGVSLRRRFRASGARVYALEPAALERRARARDRRNGGPRAVHALFPRRDPDGGDAALPPARFHALELPARVLERPGDLHCAGRAAAASAR